MHSSASRENIHKFGKPEIFRQGTSQNLLSNKHELPTQTADCFTRTACSYIIVIVHIKIEDKLSLQGSELFIVLRRRARPYCSGVQFSRSLLCERSHSGFHFLGAFKFDVALDTLVFVFEGELAVVEGQGLVVSEPVEHGLIGIEMLVIVPEVVLVHELEGK